MRCSESIVGNRELEIESQIRSYSMYKALLVAVSLFFVLFPHTAFGSAVTAFKEVSVLDMEEGKFKERYTVIVEGDRIREVGPASQVSVPEEATIIDGSGKYLIPGLGEMHGHIPPPTAPAQYVEDVLFLYLANGITTVRGMLGAPNQLDLRERANSGQLLSPTLYLAGPSFNGNSIESPEQAVEKVSRQAEEGWDLLKIHPGLTRAEYDALAEKAHQVGIEFAGHVPEDVGILHALEKGQQTIDHLDGYLQYAGGAGENPLDESKLRESVQATVEAGARVVPTLALWETIIGARELDQLTSYPELEYMPAEMVEGWTRNVRDRLENLPGTIQERKEVARNRLRLLNELQKAGVGVLLGTDAPQLFSVPGFSVHREIARMQDAGMTSLEIIRSGTVNVGQYLADKDSFGKILPGHRADLILLEADPLMDLTSLRNQAGVMVRGRWLSRQEIDQRLATIKNR